MTSPRTAGETSSKSETNADPALCPRCQSKLTNPESLGWCPKCGYCRSLADEAPKVAEEEAPAAAKPQQASLLGIKEFFALIAKMPDWLRILLMGVLLLITGTFLADRLLPVPPPDNDEVEALWPRAIWTTSEMILGLMVLFVGQVWALALLAPNEDKLGPQDAIVPFRIWHLAMKELPLTKKQVWAITWGLTALVCAPLLVGGLEYWLPEPIQKKAGKDLQGAVGFVGKEKVDLSESVKDFADTQDLSKLKKQKTTAKEVDRRPTVQCVVIGYMRGPEDTLEGLVLAVLARGKLHYGGVVRRGFKPYQSKEMLKQLGGITQDTPLIPGLETELENTIWVKPEMFCEVHYSGYELNTAKLLSPNFKGLLKKDEEEEKK